MNIISQLRQTILLVKGKKFTIHNLASSYDLISKNFSENFNLPFQEYYIQLFNLLGEITNKKILDLGCGTGWLGEQLHTNYSPAFYHGIDISTGMIYEARKKLTGGFKLKLEHGDFLKILDLIPQNSYDIVFLTWSLKFNNSKLLFNKILKVLKPGGKLALLTETKDSAREITNALKNYFENKSNQIDMVLPKIYSPENSHDLTLNFNKTGFKQTVVWNKSQTYNFSSASEVSNWAASIGLFAGWDQVLDLYQPYFYEELNNLIKPTIPGKWLITKKILGAIASK